MVSISNEVNEVRLDSEAAFGLMKGELSADWPRGMFNHLLNLSKGV